MFIVWGTKIVRKRLGRRAEFCPLCRDIRPHRLVVIQSVGHLYYIPLGTRTKVGFEETCEGCGLARQWDFDATPEVSRDRHADVESLIADTNPGLRRELADRLAFEARVRSNQLTGPERFNVLIESFAAANLLFERRTPSLSFDRESGIGCLATIVISSAILFVTSEVIKLDRDTAQGLTAAVFGVLVLYTLVLLATDSRRAARRVALPPLARAIGPLRPSDEEIEALLDVFDERKAKLARHLTAAQIQDALAFATVDR